MDFSGNGIKLTKEDRQCLHDVMMGMLMLRGKGLKEYADMLGVSYMVARRRLSAEGLNLRSVLEFCNYMSETLDGLLKAVDTRRGYEH